MSVADATVESLAGAAGAVVATFATYPLATVSVLQAVENGDSENEVENSKGTFGITGTWASLKKVVQRDGWLRLYDGLKPALFGAAVSQGVYFYFYSAIRDVVLYFQGSNMALTHPLSTPPRLSVGSSLVTASLAGCCNVMLTNPIWVLATRMQANPRRDRRQSIWRAMHEAYQEDGPRWLAKGLAPSLIMVCNPTVQYMIYESLLSTIRDMKPASRKGKGANSQPSALDIFVASALAKLGATLVTYPLLLVKSRLQVGGEDLQYEGTIHALQTIFEDEGWRGFYKGMGAKMIQSVLAAALMLMIKEKLANGARALLKR